MLTDLPKGEEVVGQSLGQIVKREWPLERSGVKKVNGLSLRDRSRIRRGKVLRSRGPFGGFKRILQLKLQ